MKKQPRSFGECYFDHYEKFFREAVDREVFRQKEGLPGIQILMYDGVFEDCRVFCSLGLTHYHLEVGNVAEVFLGADAAWGVMPGLLANALFFAVQRKMPIGRGVAITGLKTVSPEFVKRYKKNALYFTTPSGLPKKFSSLNCDGTVGKIYQAFPITEDEYDYFGKHGAEKFEDVLEESGIDPFQIARPSCLAKT